VRRCLPPIPPEQPRTRRRTQLPASLLREGSSACWRERGAPGSARHKPSGLEEKFHLHAGELDDIVVLEGVRGGADLMPVHRGAARAFDVSDEITLRPASKYRYLHP